LKEDLRASRSFDPKVASFERDATGPDPAALENERAEGSASAPGATHSDAMSAKPAADAKPGPVGDTGDAPRTGPKAAAGPAEVPRVRLIPDVTEEERAKPSREKEAARRRLAERLRQRTEANGGKEEPRKEPGAAEEPPPSGGAEAARRKIAHERDKQRALAEAERAAAGQADNGAETARPAPATVPEHAPPVLAEGRGAPSIQEFDDPLRDCLVILTAFFERPHSADALTAGLPLVDNRLTPDLFIRAAERAGLSARLVRRRLENISNLSLPCVLLLEGGDAGVLVKQRGDGKSDIILPETGRGVVEVSTEELAERYSGRALFARPEYQFDARSEATDTERPRSWFWGTLARFWRIYAQVAVATILVNSFAIASPLFIMNVYDRVVPNKAEPTMWVLAAGVVTVFAFEFILRNLRGYFVDTAGRHADVLLASRIFEQILGIKMSERPASAGAFANQMREFETLRDFFTSATMVAMVDLPFVFFFVGVIYYIAGDVALVPLAAIPLVLAAGLLLQIPLNRVVSQSARESAQKHALLVESIFGLETIKALGAEGRTQRNWERFVGVTSRSAKKARMLSQLGMFFTTFVTQMTTVGVVVVGVLIMIYGEGEQPLTIGALIASTILAGRAMAPLSQVAQVLVRFNQSMTSLKTLDYVMKMGVERPQGKTFLHRPDLQGDIEFREVTFSYPNQQIPSLERVSFHIEAGERVGIIGKIGSGKSTIEKLILGLYTPQDGSVRIDGTDINQIDPADLRRNIGYVPQDIFLFFGTVRENIAMGAPHADDAAVLRAAKISGVDNFIKKHPMGFDLNVGERGESLSGGQRQSVAIARAMVRHPNILVLDEPTSAMDKGSEDWFLARLREEAEGRTLIVVTQRVSLLSMVDRLIVMDGGRLVADGPRDKVLQTLARGGIRGASDA